VILENNPEFSYAVLLVADACTEYPLAKPAHIVWDPHHVGDVMRALDIKDIDMNLTERMLFRGLDKRYNGYYQDSMYLWRIQGGPTELAFVYHDLAQQLMGGPRGADDDTFDYWPNAFDMLYVLAQDLIALDHHPDYIFRTFVRVIDSAIALEGPPSEWEADFLDTDLNRLKELLDERKEA